MKRTIVICVALTMAAFPFAAAASSGQVKPAIAPKARPLPLRDVRLTGGPLKQAQDMNARYLLSLSPDRMMAFLRKAAGLEPKAEGYGGWDGANRQLTGHIAGHYLSGVSLMFAATGDPRFKERADYLVSELRAVQDKHGDGYIGAQADREGVPGKTLYARIAAGDIRSSGFDLNGMWSPWYVQHKIFAGLRDAYRFTGNREALEVEALFAAWAERTLSGLDDAQTQKMLGTEFGGMNEVLVDLYADTGDARWLRLSDRFEHRAVVEPLARAEDILRGKHGNTLVPKLLGSLTRYAVAGDKVDGAAAMFFWDRVALHHSFATGGHGRNEYFGEPDKLDDMIDGRTAETCNVYNMIKFARALFALDPQMRYADFHERALFNHILGSMDPADGATCYMVPVGQGVAREYQDMERDFTCCVGSGMESHALHGDGLYYGSADTLWVNIYAPSTADWKEARVRLTMATSFPEGAEAKLTIETKNPRRLELALRRPYWAGEGFAVRVNGQAVKDVGPAGSYVRVGRKWKTGDKVELTLPKSLRLEPLPDNPDRAAILWGPLVLAGDLGPIPERRPRAAGATARPQRPTTPALVTSEASPAAWIKPMDGRPGAFMTSGVGRDTDVELVPFYRLHRRTYAAYWDILTPGKWEERAAAMKAAQEAREELEAATVAFVQPGQMQTERDFNQRGGTTSPVQLQGRYGRRAADWFSFDVPIAPAGPLELVVTYGRDERADRAFAVLVEGRKVGEERIARRSPQEKEGFFDVAYPIPAESLAGREKVTVRFEGIEGRETGTVFGIRVASTAGETVIAPVRVLETPDQPIRDLAVAPDGSIFTFDYREYKVKKFDKEGRFLLEFGGTGTGAGEFTHLTGIRAFRDKLLAVDSVGLLTFGLDGRFLDKTAFPEEITPNYSLALEDGRYVGSQIVAAELKAVLTLRSAQGRELDRLASHDLKEFFPELKTGEEFFLSDEYARDYLYALSPDEDILWAASDAVRVHLYSGGKSRVIVAEDLTPVPFPEDERAKLARRKANAKPPFFAYVPDHYPLLRHLAVGPDGDIWVFAQSRERTGFLRFAKDGNPKGFATVQADFDVARSVVRVLGGRMFFISGKTLYAADLPGAGTR
jgi:DUF1680 family protein